jgi:hypothetical protein
MTEHEQRRHENKGKETNAEEKLTRDYTFSEIADYLGMREQHRNLPGVRAYTQVYADLFQLMSDLPIGGTDDLATRNQLSPQMARRYQAVRELVDVALEVLQDGVPLFGSEVPWAVSVDGMVDHMQRAVSEYPVEVRKKNILP